MKYQLKVLCGVLALALTGHTSAATTWTLGSSYGTISGGVTVSGLSNTGGTDTLASTNNNAATQTIQTATWVNTWGGIGNADACGTGSYCDSIEGTSPEHAIDNNQRYDMALLDFGLSSVKLTNVNLGWVWTDPTTGAPLGDTDLTVMRYKGTGTPVLIGKTYDLLISSGWELVGNYAGTGDNTASNKNRAINSSGVFSSYWLIGAYNPLAAGASQSGLDTQNDYFKLASVVGCVSGSTGCNPPTGKIPEPGSMALMGIGLLGLIRLRKMARQS